MLPVPCAFPGTRGGGAVLPWFGVTSGKGQDHGRIRRSGRALRAASVRHALATLLVFLGLFSYFYGPPLTRACSRGAPRRSATG